MAAVRGRGEERSGRKGRGQEYNMVMLVRVRVGVRVSREGLRLS